MACFTVNFTFYLAENTLHSDCNTDAFMLSGKLAALADGQRGLCQNIVDVSEDTPCSSTVRHVAAIRTARLTLVPVHA